MSWNRDGIHSLLRYARKNWSSGDDYNNMPDEEDTDLIATAPQLLDALENAAETFRCMFFYDEALRDHYPWIGESLKKADAAIAKAKGEPE